LHAFGDPELVALKRRVTEALAAGEAPSAVGVANNRFARASVRVALRQLRASGESLPKLSAWEAAHDGAGHAGAEQEDPAAASGH
jgi:hypothetical protein